MSTDTEQKQTAILEDGAHSRGDRSRNVGAHSSLGMSLAKENEVLAPELKPSAKQSS